MNNALRAIRDALAEAKAHDIEYFPLRFTEVILESSWEPPDEIEEGDLFLRSLSTHPREWVAEPALKKSAAPALLKRPPPWYLGLSKSFKEAVAGIDRKLQGRILEAISDIVSDPMTPRGDTIKPLRADLDGCWRYRIGDYRLVYSPDASTGDITLLTFAARGSIYDD
jgi:mRNA-degrading endonuclease RelE of RelBE toxin-antitoxin system